MSTRTIVDLDPHISLYIEFGRVLKYLKHLVPLHEVISAHGTNRYATNSKSLPRIPTPSTYAKMPVHG